MSVALPVGLLILAAALYAVVMFRFRLQWWTVFIAAIVFLVLASWLLRPNAEDPEVVAPVRTRQP